MTPSKVNRRDFLKTTSLTGLALAAPSLNVLGANDDLRLAVIGLGGKGGQHVERFSQAPGVRVTALGEPDPKRLAAHANKLKQRGTTVFTATDPRRVVERPDVDAVVIATPNHWHALPTVWALRAGKDVYVEKPVSHSVGEGARMVEETKRAGRIVQSGTQYRSCPGLLEAAAWLQEGHCGKPLWAHIVWFEHRPPIGKCAPFIPTDLDYDLWCGPAPFEPLTRPQLHYDWHWFWSTGDVVYRHARVLRPFFANVRAPSGVAVTRHHPPIAGTDATDHDTMHPGVWLAFGDLNGQDFWRNQGRIDHVRFTELPQAEKQRINFATECRLLAADGATLGSLSNRFTLIALTNAWLMVWEATFHSGDADLVFGDQEEMGFGARVATAITEKNGGVITSSYGLHTAKRTWGQPAEWCDYSGTVNGQQIGLTLMTDPANFRPAWWHNRDYGLMVANPFGQEAMKQGAKSRVTVKRGESFRLRFGAAIYQGSLEKAAALYQAFLLVTARAWLYDRMQKAVAGE